MLCCARHSFELNLLAAKPVTDLNPEGGLPGLLLESVCYGNCTALMSLLPNATYDLLLVNVGNESCTGSLGP